MRWASALSRNAVADAALAECAAKVRADLGGAAPDVCFVFASAHHAAAYDDLPDALRDVLAPRHVLGCSAGGVIGDGREVEAAPGLSVTAAVLPGVELRPFHLLDAALPDSDAGPQPWEQAVGVPAAGAPQFVILADPFTIRADEMLAGLDFAYARSVKVGGLASGARAPGGNALFLDGAAHREGAAGVAFSGDVRIDTLVAQGCRPIGAPHTITACRHNILLELDGRKPVEILSALYEAAGEADRRLMQSALFLGVIMDPFRKGPPKAGDFLIRNLMGRDPQSDGLVVGSLLRDGLTVQFHVRDAAAAREDLTAVLHRYAAEAGGGGGGAPPPAGRAPAGALLFSCLGRGKHLFGRADHDTDLFRGELGPVPLGGFFCNGEVGPVGGVTYIHGFTSCFGLFRSEKFTAAP
jgi:small ligand-binding sensory domain FIST